MVGIEEVLLGGFLEAVHPFFLHPGAPGDAREKLLKIEIDPNVLEVDHLGAFVHSCIEVFVLFKVLAFAVDPVYRDELLEL